MYTPQLRGKREISFSRRVTLQKIWDMLDRKYPMAQMNTSSEEKSSKIFKK